MYLVVEIKTFSLLFVSIEESSIDLSCRVVGTLMNGTPKPGTLK